MERNKYLYAGLVLISFVLLAHAEKSSQGDKDHPQKKLYMKKCGSCHGKDLKGKAIIAKALKIEPGLLDLASETAAKKSKAELIQVISNGEDKMPAFKKKLKEEEIAGLVDYIRTVVPAIKEEELKPQKKAEEADE